MEEVEFGSKRRRKEFTPWVVAADVVGLTTIIVSTAALILGETTPIFSFLKDPHPGVQFVFRYIAAPVFPLASRFLPRPGSDWMTVILLGLGVALFAAVIYALVAYIIVRAVCRSIGRKS